MSENKAYIEKKHDYIYVKFDRLFSANTQFGISPLVSPDLSKVCQKLTFFDRNGTIF